MNNEKINYFLLGCIIVGVFSAIIFAALFTEGTFYKPDDQKVSWIGLDTGYNPAVVCDKLVVIQTDGDFICISKSFSYNNKEDSKVLIKISNIKSKNGYDEVLKK